MGDFPRLPRQVVIHPEAEEIAPHPKVETHALGELQLLAEPRVRVLLRDGVRPPGFETHPAPLMEQAHIDEIGATAEARGREPGSAEDDALDGLRADFAGFVPSVHMLLHRTQTLVRTDIFDFAPVASWHHGRVVLTGDAAHAATPNLGQGANQAIETAFVVAQVLASETLPGALMTYERVRMPKAHWVTRQSWRYGELTNLPGALGGT